MNYRKLLIPALLMLLAGHKANSQCYRAVNASASLLVGADQNGFTEGMEFGVWGVDRPVGLYAGFMTYNQLQTYTQGGKTASYMMPTLDFHARATFKVYQDDHFWHVLTAYVSGKGDVGASYRLYKPLGDHVVIGVEPGVSLKRQGTVNTLFTFNF